MANIYYFYNIHWTRKLISWFYPFPALFLVSHVLLDLFIFFRWLSICSWFKIISPENYEVIHPLFSFIRWSQENYDNNFILTTLRSLYIHINVLKCYHNMHKCGSFKFKLAGHLTDLPVQRFRSSFCSGKLSYVILNFSCFLLPLFPPSGNSIT